jgi:hypothetical protein
MAGRGWLPAVTAVRYRVRCLLRSGLKAGVGLAVLVAAVGGIVLTLVAGAHRTATVADRYSDARGDRWDTQMEQGDGPALTEDVAALPAVREVVGATFLFAGFLDDDGVPIEAAIAFAGDPEAFGAELTEGRRAETSREFVASPDFLDVTGAEVGDVFPFISISAETAEEFGFDVEALDGPSFDATLVGVVESPAADLEDSFALTAFRRSVFDEGSIGGSATEFLVGLNDGFTLSDLRAQLDDLQVQRDGQTIDGSSLTLDPAEWVDPGLRQAVSAQAVALWVVTTIVAVAGVVVVGQVAVRQARLTEDQRLSLSSLGFTRAQVVADAVARIAVPAVVGAVGAVGVAYLASGRFPVGFVEALEPEPGLRFDPLVHVLAGVGLVVGLVGWVGAFLVISQRRERRRRPASYGESLTAKVGHLQAAIGLRIAFARHPRDTGGISTPVFGLFAILVVLVGAVTFGRTVDALVDDPARQGQTFDGAIGQGGGEVPPEVAERIAANPEVESVTLLGTIAVSIGDDGFNITSFRPVSGDLGLRLLDGRAPSAEDEVAIGALAAEQFDVGVGDQLTVSAANGERTLDVVGVAVLPPVEGADGLGEGGLVDEATFRALDDGAALTAAAVSFGSGDVEAARQRVSDELGFQIVGQDPASAVVNLDRVRSSPYVVAAILLVLALLSLGNLVGTALRRRGKELAVLRASGADRRWLGGVVHWHTTAFTLAVSALALPFGIAAGRLVFQRFIADELGVADDTVVPWAGLGALLVGLLVLAEVVGQHAVRRRRASVARQLTAE